ncbi:aspartic-type endopeptidase [Galdieria sulphuraria]|uniref:Aspartic-type endopeptidase n=1 Tax=Galdieria sulphuraria TaxID=130081 RepID=M2W8D1_GALSU|nr:aspartic-type endopeptidase [Galdieria sulphuraria]EME32136.1 aspartic-type endopeptidase [Galdieria sulphuraria]|eukprot:XP_005708656.1 aspartic-type endopeptidase [Galdieria sulphuraria]
MLNQRGIQTHFSWMMINKMLLLSYSALVGVLLLPVVLKVPVFLQMIISATSCVVLGSYRAAKKEQERKRKGGSRDAQVITERDAYKFPVIASLSLLGLFFAFKFLPEYWLNLFLTVYVVVLGASAFFTFVLPLVEDFLSYLSLNRELYFNVTLAHIICFMIASLVGYWNVSSKSWLSNNMMGTSLSVLGIEMLALGDFLSSCILLFGLFFYDIFWVFASKPVFGANVMVTVAKNFNGPIKLIFPKSFSGSSEEYSMLGLGDIVIPGLFVAMILRFDWRNLRNQNEEETKTPYFTTVLSKSLTQPSRHSYI